MLRSGAVVLSLLASSSAFAQMAISVQSGLIHHVEGTVLAQGRPVRMEYAKFPQIKEGQTLETRYGRAELLLTPGVFLRVGENSGVKMIANALTDTRVEITEGAALVEVVEVDKQYHVKIRVGESETALTRAGLYLFDAKNARIRVYEGKALVSMNDESLPVSKGRELGVESELVAGKFNAKDTDALYDWSQQRAYLVARANLSAANSYNSNGYRMSTNGWAWYGDMGMLTFLPRSGYYRGPFGWSFYSPGAIWQYNSRNYQGGGYNNGSNGGGGGNTNHSTWSGLGGNSSAAASAPMGSSNSGSAMRSSAPAAAPAASAPAGGRGR